MQMLFAASASLDKEKSWGNTDTESGKVANLLNVYKGPTIPIIITETTATKKEQNVLRVIALYIIT